MLKFNRCPVCHGPQSKWRTKTISKVAYNIDRCKLCNYAFVNPRPSFDFLMNYYSLSGHANGNSDSILQSVNALITQEERYPNSCLDARRILSVVKSLEHNKQYDRRTLLDVGCGYGFFSKEAMDLGFEVVALELADNERSIASEFAGVQPISCSFEDYEQSIESFDVILMSHILEHAIDVNLWISKAHELLTDKGIIAIAVPNFASAFRLIMQENEPYICPPDHLNFFSPRNLTKLLNKHGFEVEKTQWISRLPMETFEKRMPDRIKPLAPFASVMSNAVLHIVDKLRLGMVVNIYARKTSVCPATS